MNGFDPTPCLHDAPLLLFLFIYKGFHGTAQTERSVIPTSNKEKKTGEKSKQNIQHFFVKVFLFIFLFLLSFLVSHLLCLFVGYVETKKDQHKSVMQVCLSIFVCALYLEITEGLTKIDCI